MTPARLSTIKRAARVIALIVGLLVVSGVFAFAIMGKTFIANAIVIAPNRGRMFHAADDPRPSDLVTHGVARQLRVDVGPPAASLSVWVVDPPAPPRATVLVLHGIRSDKFWQLGLAHAVANAGYRAVVPDLRGHGSSSGDFLTYGVVDAHDLSQVLDALARADLVAGRIGVMGTSYGAATAIELAGLDQRIAAVVAVAPFSSLREVVPAYAKHYAPGLSALIPRSFLDDAIARAGRMGGFDPDAASPLSAIAKARARVLLIHGALDTNIPPSQSEALRAAAPERTRLILVDDADHFTIAADRSINTDGIAWLKAHLEERS